MGFGFDMGHQRNSLAMNRPQKKNIKNKKGIFEHVYGSSKSIYPHFSYKTTIQIGERILFSDHVPLEVGGIMFMPFPS